MGLKAPLQEENRPEVSVAQSRYGLFRSLWQRCASAIYLCYPYVVDGAYQDPQIEYCINPYTKVFLSRRGDLRIYRGNISYINGNFALANKDRSIQRTTNKRIRKEAENEERSQTYSYYKKSLGPKQYSGW